jgi:RNA polymerase sigma-70 factor (ECF subfamily)
MKTRVIALSSELSRPHVVPLPGFGRADMQECRRGMAEAELSQELDQELVRRVQRGDSAAFDLLVRKYQHRIAGLIGRYIADWSECQDVAQETFLRAYRAIGNFRGDAQFYTWLHRIAVNTAKNHLVAHGRRPRTDDIDIEDAEQFASSMRLRDNDTPERELMRQQLEQTVMRAVEALPEELRTAITLREAEGLSYEEIARKMDCPIGTVRSRIFRAREAIDLEMQPLMDGGSITERAKR